MSDVLVYAVPGSPFARSVMAALEEKGASWRLAPLSPREVKGSAHLARHPFGRVPVIEHEGFSLYETQAILRYIDRALPGPALTPEAPKAAARMDQAMNINDWYLFQGCAAVPFQRVIGPRLLGLVPDEAAIAAAMPRARQVFAELARLLGEEAYFAGPALSLADLALAPLLDFFAAAPEWAELTAGAGNLVDWMDRMISRPALRATTWDRVEAMAHAA